MKCKFGMKHYSKPTPKKWRKLGDSLLAASVFATTFTMIMKYEYLSIGIVIVGVIGKFLTNFFSEEDKTIKEDEN